MSGVYLRREGDVLVLNLGGPDERAVVFTEERMRSLSEALDEAAKVTGVRGLVVCGSSPTMFCAGADIQLIRTVTDRVRGEELAAQGQAVFQKLESLPFRTIAAISGPAVGGGFEITLACDYRIATDLPSTKIGLPEVKIGILPGFGGTQRLPQLVGIRRALDIILKAKILPAPRAFASGMVDRVLTPFENEDEESLWARLLKEAKTLAAANTPLTPRPVGVVDRLIATFPPVRSVVRTRAIQAVRKESKGFYPAPERALECVFLGLKKGKEAGYREEQKGIGELVISPESKSLVHIFLVSEESQKLGRMVKLSATRKVASVLGGGVMVAGIASVLSGAGFTTKVLEPAAPVREKALQHIRESLAKKRSLSSAERETALNALKLTDDRDSLMDSDFVIEAIVEDLAVKRDVLGRLAEGLSSKALIATNTSSLSVSAIADGLKNPERVIGLHFFNPVEKMPLVEVVRGEKSSDETAILGAALAALCGKYPVVCEDKPGFLVNRILTPYLVEASLLLGEGFSVQAIDRAATRFGMPMGPLRLLDEIGLDTAAKVSIILENAYGERMKGHRYAEALLGLGKLGRKNNSGFYIYETNGSTPDPNIQTKLGIRAPVKEPGKNDTELQERLILPMINEAVRALDEGGAGYPGPEAAGQIDLATVMGMGFPPFRGGILFYAEKLGAGEVLSRLRHYEKTLGARFAPSPGVVSRGERKLSFLTNV